LRDQVQRTSVRLVDVEFREKTRRRAYGHAKEDELAVSRVDERLLGETAAGGPDGDVVDERRAGDGQADLNGHLARVVRVLDVVEGGGAVVVFGDQGLASEEAALGVAGGGVDA